ncbi:type IV toxin-antitoxin system AbiEi family antitoxin domain-containing protein [Planctomycetes bacterium Poly30]|uniref:type IV toxin-antitoxin system AbiEi family antitoxin domain-containing protein n=1 Tax=Saltatorellus ferox TaxID=2528018 RepID=UPI0011A5B9A1
MSDSRLIQQLSPPQKGVFSLADLQSALSDPHRASMYRRLDRLEESGDLRRFTRGIYVAEDFDLATLSQRVSPGSTISFEYVLARSLVIGPKPRHGVSALREGRGATFEGCGVRLDYHHVGEKLRFGEVSGDGVRTTDPEKAILDVLYFHLRGRKALMDIYSDVNLQRLDHKKLDRYLSHYSNSKFVAFARDLLLVAEGDRP